MRGSPLLGPLGHQQHHSMTSVLPSANGWLRLLLALAALLWLAFFLVMYNALFRHEQLAGLGARGCSNQQQEQQGGAPPPAHDNAADAALRNEVEELRRVNQELRQRLDDVAEGRTNSPREERLLRVAGRRRNVGSDKAVEQKEEEEGVNRDATTAAQLPPAQAHLKRPTGTLKTGLYSVEHEVARRHLHNQILEVLFALRGKENATSARNTNGDDRVLEQMISLLADSELFGTAVDGAAEWHGRELARLTSFIQSRLHSLQHPKDCSTAPLIVCNLDKGCGFGCQLHHVSYCLMVAAATNRTMVLEGDGHKWLYSPDGWTSAFLPISSCSDAHAQSRAASEREPWWDGWDQTNFSVLILPVVDFVHSKPKQLPLSFPVELRDELLTHHGNPPVFFAAQFIHYMMSDNAKVKAHLVQLEAKIPFDEGPIVGLQIRRTDKIGTEAAYHSVEEYMRWADYWFRVQQHIRDRSAANITSAIASDTFSTPQGSQPPPSATTTATRVKRRVFVATDDPAVVGELRSKYPDYEVYANDDGALTAQMSKRYSESSLIEVLADIRLLSRCSYLVCTFSSQVCRVGYELMQVIGGGDMANSFHSLDDIYYYGGQFAHEQVAVESHKVAKVGADEAVTGEIELEVGDTLGIAGNHWDGWSKGANRRTGKLGLYPSYKALEKWRIVPFPLFNLSTPLDGRAADGHR